MANLTNLSLGFDKQSFLSVEVHRIKLQFESADSKFTTTLIVHEELFLI